MDKEILLTLGRVVYINFGPLAGKIAVVVDIVNGNRVIIDGSSMGVERQMISNKRLTLTRFRIPGVVKAEKDLKAKPKDDAAKKALAVAYVNRGLALTDARQYASALGDYRKAQKLDPSNADANKWVEQIIGIYESMNKEYPKEGEEPPPLPLDKNATANKNTAY